LPPNPGTYVEFGIQVDPEGSFPRAIDIYRSVASVSKSKVAASLFAILLGWIGVHKFYLGHPGKGIILILVGLLTFGLGLFVTVPLTVIEGLIYLSKSDEDFNRIYVQEKRGWF
jgi:TM2 domain-containing membrane protein YozV